MNKESNIYIFIYSTVLVVLVATLLALASIWLKPYQDKNREIEKKMNILFSVNKAQALDQAKDKDAYIEQEYAKYIKESYNVNASGEKIEGDAFSVDLAVEFKKPIEQRKYPVMISVDDNGARKYILPVRGTGLWGPLWGYVALNDDFNTIAGVVFDHKGETPGLGAEIATVAFQQQFVGKQIFDGSTFTSVRVVKGGNTGNDAHAVDAISGGTITSEGLQKMIADVLRAYVPYIRQQQQLRIAAQQQADTTTPQAN